MESGTWRAGAVHLGRSGCGDDLLAEIEGLARRRGIECGLVSVIGSVSAAALGYYDQNERVYHTVYFHRPLEIVSGIGNISLKEGEPFCHLHLTLSDERGRAFGGHLMPGTVVFAAEIQVTELSGPPLIRLPDEVTGLSLWRLPEG